MQLQHTHRFVFSALTALVCLLAMPSTSQALEPPMPVQSEREWTIQLDPLTTAIGFVHLQVERSLGSSFSLYLSPHARFFNGILTEGDEPFLGLGVEGGVRWFFTGDAPEGGWVLVRGVAAHLSTDEPTSQTAFGGYISALVGYTAILDSGLVLSGGAGAQYLNYRIAGFGPDKGPLIALHTAIGWAF